MNSLWSRAFDVRSGAAALKEAALSLVRYRELVVELARREIVDRFAGSALGGIWAVLSPALLLGANVFCFMYVMRIRFSPEDTGLKYALYVLVGNTPWLAMQEAIVRGTSAVSSNAALVKQIVFPNEILPAKVTLGVLPSLLVGVAISIILAICNETISLYGCLVLLPLAILWFVIMAGGFVYLLAGIGVFFKDLRELTAIVLSVGMFLHPIFYPPDTSPAWLETFFLISPMSHLIWCFRDALFHGEIVHPWSWLIAPLVSIVFFSLGWRTFRLLRPSFGNAL